MNLSVDIIHTETQSLTLSLPHASGKVLSVQVTRVVDKTTGTKSEVTLSCMAGHYTMQEWAVIAKLLEIAFDRFRDKYGPIDKHAELQAKKKGY